jgi:hypothetical protein
MEAAPAPPARRGRAPCSSLCSSQSSVQHEGKEGSLENSCGLARARPRTRPLRLGRHLLKHDGGSATQKFSARCGRSLCSCAVNRVQREGRQRRSKIHAARRVLSPPQPTAIGASFIPNTMEAALHSNSLARWAFLALVRNKSCHEEGST